MTPSDFKKKVDQNIRQAIAVAVFKIENNLSNMVEIKPYEITYRYPEVIMEGIRDYFIKNGWTVLKSGTIYSIYPEPIEEK